jgi:hypothetical protein
MRRCFLPCSTYAHGTVPYAAARASTKKQSEVSAQSFRRQMELDVRRRRRTSREPADLRILAIDVVSCPAACARIHPGARGIGIPCDSSICGKHVSLAPKAQCEDRLVRRRSSTNGCPKGRCGCFRRSHSLCFSLSNACTYHIATATEPIAAT